MRVSNRIADPTRKLQLLTGARISIDANELASNYLIGVPEPPSIVLLLSGQWHPLPDRPLRLRSRRDDFWLSVIRIRFKILYEQTRKSLGSLVKLRLVRPRVPWRENIAGYSVALSDVVEIEYRIRGHRCISESTRVDLADHLARVLQ